MQSLFFTRSRVEVPSLTQLEYAALAPHEHINA